MKKYKINYFYDKDSYDFCDLIDSVIEQFLEDVL